MAWTKVFIDADPRSTHEPVREADASVNVWWRQVTGRAPFPRTTKTILMDGQYIRAAIWEGDSYPGGARMIIVVREP